MLYKPGEQGTNETIQQVALSGKQKNLREEKD